jgi:hypothetical protein
MSPNMEMERILQPQGASGITPGNEWHGIPARKYIGLREDSKTTDVRLLDLVQIMHDGTKRTYISTRANA